MPIPVPAEVAACQTRLVGDFGEIEFTPPFFTAPAVEKSFSGVCLAKSSDPVVAIDIGTTTLAAVKISNGAVVASAGAVNGQNLYGDNVVSRIAMAAETSGMQKLRSALLDSLADLTEQLDISDVRRIAVSGNTVMTSILHGVDPSPIGSYPFTPPVRQFPTRNDLLFSLPVLTVPCISGYLGGDVVAGLYVSALRPGEMLVDLGTNCEVVMRTSDGWFGVSAAAGPAFEGAGLRSGCGAVSGAVDHYYAPGNFSVIGGGIPGGICGSAYVDYLAVERNCGRLNEFGRFIPPGPIRTIAPGLEVGEDDIELLLKAKAAISSGISVLEKTCGIAAKRIFLSGGFASGLDLDHAVSIGMLPRREFIKLGNSSLAGAAALATAPELMPELKRLSDLPREMPLAEISGFEQAFINALLLPPNGCQPEIR